MDREQDTMNERERLQDDQVAQDTGSGDRDQYSQTDTLHDA